jgi:hypothetical protein
MLFDRAMGSDSQPDAIWALYRQLNTLADQVDQTKIEFGGWRLIAVDSD